MHWSERRGQPRTGRSMAHTPDNHMPWHKGWRLKNGPVPCCLVCGLASLHDGVPFGSCFEALDASRIEDQSRHVSSLSPLGQHYARRYEGSSLDLKIYLADCGDWRLLRELERLMRRQKYRR